MSGLRIEQVDVHDDSALAAWHAVYAAAERHRHEDIATLWSLPALAVTFRESNLRFQNAIFAGAADGRTVAVGWLRAPLLDNLDRADLSVHVLPEERRRGHGTAVLAHLERVAAQWGRSILGGETTFRFDAGAEGTGESGPEFGRANGYQIALAEIQRRLLLPVPDRRLDELAAQAAAHHAAYSLRSWVGPVPDDLLEGFVELAASVSTEAPVGELDVEPEKADVTAHREQEARMGKQGAVKYNTVALDADGELVAYTDLATIVHEPGRAYQWGTLVRADHRGHRLGLAVKVANIRLLQAERPDIDHVVTFNAEVNRHMIEVNEALGYQKVGRLGQLQKRQVIPAHHPSAGR